MRRIHLEAIGKRLAYIRASKSQREHAEALGVPVRTYQNYERGDREPDVRTLLALMDLGWSSNWVLVGEGPEQLSAAVNVGEQTGPDGSHAGRPHEPMLRGAIETVESGLDVLDLELPARAKAALVAVVYDRLVEEGMSPAQLVAFVLQSIKETINESGG